MISPFASAVDVQAERLSHAAARHAAQLLSGSELLLSQAPRPQYRIQAVVTFREAGPICKTVPYSATQLVLGHTPCPASFAAASDHVGTSIILRPVRQPPSGDDGALGHQSLGGIAPQRNQ